jgi:hypothetical protein
MVLVSFILLAFFSRGGTAHQAGYDNNIFVPILPDATALPKGSNRKTKAKKMVV